MFRIRVELPCDADGRLSEWWRMAMQEGYRLSFENGCLVITGNKRTQQDLDKLNKFVEKYPLYSIYADNLP